MRCCTHLEQWNANAATTFVTLWSAWKRCSWNTVKATIKWYSPPCSIRVNESRRDWLNYILLKLRNILGGNNRMWRGDVGFETLEILVSVKQVWYVVCLLGWNALDKCHQKFFKDTKNFKRGKKRWSDIVVQS